MVNLLDICIWTSYYFGWISNWEFKNLSLIGLYRPSSHFCLGWMRHTKSYLLSKMLFQKSNRTQQLIEVFGFLCGRVNVFNSFHLFVVMWFVYSFFWYLGFSNPPKHSFLFCNPNWFSLVKFCRYSLQCWSIPCFAFSCN